MQIGLIHAGLVFGALGVWWVVLWVRGVRTPPSGRSGDSIDPNIV